jgi:hypothetical protein
MDAPATPAMFVRVCMSRPSIRYANAVSRTPAETPHARISFSDLHEAGAGAISSTRHQNAVALTTLQSFALRESLIEKPWFKRLE